MTVTVIAAWIVVAVAVSLLFCAGFAMLAQSRKIDELTATLRLERRARVHAEAQAKAEKRLAQTVWAAAIDIVRERDSQ